MARFTLLRGEFFANVWAAGREETAKARKREGRAKELNQLNSFARPSRFRDFAVS